jgi:type IV pilus assembly protein PilC
MRMEVPTTGPNRREEASRLALERAPKPKVESTRDGENDPVRARPETSIPTIPVVPQTYKPVAAAAAPLGAPRRTAALAPRRPDGFGTDLKKRLRRLVDRSARVEPEDVVIFTRQFSAMVSAGLQLHQALHFYAESHTESGLGEVISEVAGKVSQGSTLSAAMRQHPTVFPEVYTGLIAAGETTGMLVAILSKLAELCERNQKLRQKVLAAITYPAVVMVVSLICIAVFIWVVLPMFVPMFNQLGVQLPWPTRMLLWLSDAGRNPVLLTTLGLSIPLLWLSWPFWRHFFGNPRRKRAIDRALLGLPYFGLLIERIITARLLFSMASLLDAGIPFTNCLEKCEHVAGNAEIAHRLKMARGLLIEGDSAADCLAAHHVFPRGAIQMIAVGEESAQLSEMIRRVATVYEEDVQMALMDLASMLEPLILLVMGVVVGFIVLASALPTAQLLQSL